ncbi:hypothetical protein MMC30_002212 [Trapelia coarctata]|nr:hypothetical protein [Trapelia coarctata]
MDGFRKLATAKKVRTANVAQSSKRPSNASSRATTSGNSIGPASPSPPIRALLNDQIPANQTLNLNLISHARLSKKRDSIDLTGASDDEDHVAKVRKLKHNGRASPLNATQGARSTGVAVVIPQLKPSTATTAAERISKSHYGNPSSKISKTKYAERLRQIPGPPVTLRNDIGDTTPSTNFTFISKFKFGPGTRPLGLEWRTGCSCDQENGRGVGCEYLNCDCLEDSARDESGKLLGFPYYSTGKKKGCMRDMFLNSRYALYECNSLCNCRENCKSRVVQKGRQVRLEIFKTKDNRGWGLCSLDDIQKGQFIDTYLGEVITDDEATRREHAVAKGKESFLFNLDKFQGQPKDDQYIPQKDIYVVDGEFMGGPTRFINHSCDPNLRQFTVTSYRGDLHVYDLAFFALENIPAGTELTFDYLDKDDEKVTGDNVQALEKAKGKLATKCLCGSENCRKYLWL